MNNKKYHECVKSELDLFHTQPLDTSNEEGWWSYISATNLADNQGEFVIDIPPANDYIDLASCQLYVKATIFKNGSNFDENAQIGPVNNFLNSCFKQIAVLSGTSPIENTNITYPYKAYLLNLLNFNKDAKNTFLNTSLFYKDNGKQMESITWKSSKKETTANSENEVDVSLEVNPGLLARRKVFLDGKGTAEMLGSMHLDFFNTEKFLMPQIPVKIKFTKNDEKFCLMGAEKNGWNFKFDDVKIRVRYQKVSNSVKLAHEHALLNKNASYPNCSNICKVFAINNVSLLVSQIISTSHMPDKIILAMADPLASTGVENKNPFNFQHFHIESMTLRIENFEKPYLNTAILDFDGYMSLFDALNNQHDGNDITRDDWKNGYTIFGFNLQLVITCAGDYLHSKKTASISAQMKFHKESISGLTGGRSISLIALLIYGSEFEITKEKKIIPSISYDLL
jgi:hypothetical protein